MPENVDLKRKVFEQLDSLADSAVILASSTSCLMPSLFTADLRHKSQCIVAHPVSGCVGGGSMSIKGHMHGFHYNWPAIHSVVKQKFMGCVRMCVQSCCLWLCKH